jgi:predicted TIM-barrel fold metal-dependent hydrolase
MDRDMKFHIYNMEHEPLCWENKALEFDYAEDAHDFLRDVDEDMLDGCVIVQDILYYDGGYINATDLRIVNDELVKMEER